MSAAPVKNARPPQRAQRPACTTNRAGQQPARETKPEACRRTSDRTNLSAEAQGPEKGRDARKVEARLAALENAFQDSPPAQPRGGGGCGGGGAAQKPGGCGSSCSGSGEGEKSKDPNGQVIADVLAVLASRAGGGDPGAATAKLRESYSKAQGQLKPEVESLAQVALGGSPRPAGGAKAGC